MKTKYVRLLSYDNALKLIDFANNIGGDTYASITVGGVSIQASDDEVWETIDGFLSELGRPFEITELNPSVVEKNIVSDFKLKGII